VDEQASKSYPAEVVLATHNTHSVDQALALYRAQRHLGGKQPVQKLVFAQLMGMADEISMKLASDIQENRIMEPATSNDHSEEKQVRKAETGVSVYKYTVWGTFEECLLYMLRRAEENQDAVSRSRETAGLMLREVGNRLAFWK
jgi:proline dehydrogenase